jgi:hypothetical protein
MVKDLHLYLSNYIQSNFIKLYEQSSLINSKESLKIFQLSLCRLPILTGDMIENDFQILKRTISPELLQKVKQDIDHLSELHAIIKYIKKNREFPAKKVRYTPLQVKDFLHRCYIYTGRKVWNCPEIMSHKYPNYLIHKNRLRLNQLIEEGIESVVADFIPIQDFYAHFSEIFSSNKLNVCPNFPVVPSEPASPASPIADEEPPPPPTPHSSTPEQVPLLEEKKSTENKFELFNFDYLEPLQPSDLSLKKILIEPYPKQKKTFVPGRDLIKIVSPRKPGRKKISFLLPGKKIKISPLKGVKSEPARASHEKSEVRPSKEQKLPSEEQLFNTGSYVNSKTSPTESVSSPAIQLFNSSKALSHISSNASESFQLDSPVSKEVQPKVIESVGGRPKMVFSEENDLSEIPENDCPSLEEDKRSDTSSGSDKIEHHVGPTLSDNDSDILEIDLDYDKPKKKLMWAPNRARKIQRKSQTLGKSTSSSIGRIAGGSESDSQSTFDKSYDYGSIGTDLTRVNRFMGLDMSPKDLLRFGQSYETSELSRDKIDLFQKQYDQQMLRNDNLKKFRSIKVSNFPASQPPKVSHVRHRKPLKRGFA